MKVNATCTSPGKLTDLLSKCVESTVWNREVNKSICTLKIECFVVTATHLYTFHF